MSLAGSMLQSSPTQPHINKAALEECITACFDCTQTCTSCADACLAEQQREMLLRCIRLDLDCADICDTTGKLLSRQVAFDSTLARMMLQTCALACRICGAECEQHGRHGMEHCRICAEVCRHCEEACNKLLAVLVA
ncbi:MAG TPA: four-helix bundle copper-binding protein [Ktedonobacterales bacterium]|nr:four-helix bundle copper-binding protein [Ktedonobacterales bacterium]